MENLLPGFAIPDLWLDLTNQAKRISAKKPDQTIENLSEVLGMLQKKVEMVWHSASNS